MTQLFLATFDSVAADGALSGYTPETGTFTNITGSPTVKFASPSYSLFASGSGDWWGADLNGTSGSSNRDARFTVRAGGGGGQMILRKTDANNYIEFLWDADASVRLRVFVGGSELYTSGYIGTGVGWQYEDRIVRVSIVSNALIVYLDGTKIAPAGASVDISTLPSGGVDRVEGRYGSGGTLVQYRRIDVTDGGGSNVRTQPIVGPTQSILTKGLVS